MTSVQQLFGSCPLLLIIMILDKRNSKEKLNVKQNNNILRKQITKNARANKRSWFCEIAVDAHMH